jgi:hypothetical protein
MKPNYRKIYEKCHGPIPLDEEGRTFDIHHIDGNRKNNDPSNLIALSIKDHYEIHYSKGDWAACLRMSERMKLSVEEKSVLSSRATRKRLDEGTHPFLRKDFAKDANKQRVEEGTHNFLDGEFHRQVQQKLIDEGTHHFLGGDLQRRRIADGTHPFLRQREIVTCPHCDKDGPKPQMIRWHFDNCKEKTCV